MLIYFSLFDFSHPSNMRPGRLLKKNSNLGGRLLEGAYLREGAYYKKYRTIVYFCAL